MLLANAWGAAVLLREFRQRAPIPPED